MAAATATAAADCARVLTSKGYALTKASLNAAQVQWIRDQLTVSPKKQAGMPSYAAAAIPSFPIYFESPTRFYVPRAWGIKTYGPPEMDLVSEGVDLPAAIQWNPAFPAHDFQEDIITTFIEKGANGLICVPCGYGKTFMALQIGVRLGKRFLIVVDKEFLMNQWRAEIEQFIVGMNGSARVGILQANKVQVDATKYDVTICMIQTICRRDFPTGFFDQYGLTIFDECHHLGASYFCNALKKVQTRAMLGLSATPDREDGLSKVFEAYLGGAIYKNTQRAPDKEAVVKAVWFRAEEDDPVYAKVPINYRGEVITAKLINQVAEYEPRNRLILRLLAEYVAHPARNILLISDRISQLDWFYAAIQATYPDCPVGYYIGGMKQAKLDENAARCRILLATYQMTAEGFSVKKLNTIVFLTSRKKVEQASGRIFRERIDARTVAPHIIDVIDSHDCHRRRWSTRQKFYKECHYTIEHIGKVRGGAASARADSDEEKDSDEEPATGSTAATGSLFDFSGDEEDAAAEDN